MLGTARYGVPAAWCLAAGTRNLVHRNSVCSTRQISHAFKLDTTQTRDSLNIACQPTFLLGQSQRGLASVGLTGIGRILVAWNGLVWIHLTFFDMSYRVGAMLYIINSVEGPLL